jgi:hypothetical protein
MARTIPQRKQTPVERPAEAGLDARNPETPAQSNAGRPGLVPRLDRLVEVLTLPLTAADHRGSRYTINQPDGISAVVLIPHRFRPTKFIQIGVSLEVNGEKQ